MPLINGVKMAWYVFLPHNRIRRETRFDLVAGQLEVLPDNLTLSPFASFFQHIETNMLLTVSHAYEATDQRNAIMPMRD